MSAAPSTTAEHNKPTFGSEAIVAAVLTLGTGLMFEAGALTSYLGSSHPLVASHWLAALAGVYQLYLCVRSGANVGRLTLLLVWATGTFAALLLQLPTLLFVASQLLMISITRSLLFHPRPLAFAADLGLGLLAALGAAWMLMQTHSALLTIWTYFLIQAGWSWIDEMHQRKANTTQPGLREFEAAHATATAAIRRLTRRYRA